MFFFVWVYPYYCNRCYCRRQWRLCTYEPTTAIESVFMRIALFSLANFKQINTVDFFFFFILLFTLHVVGKFSERYNLTFTSCIWCISCKKQLYVEYRTIQDKWHCLCICVSVCVRCMCKGMRFTNSIAYKIPLHNNIQPLMQTMFAL